MTLRFGTETDSGIWQRKRRETVGEHVQHGSRVPAIRP